MQQQHQYQCRKLASTYNEYNYTFNIFCKEPSDYSMHVLGIVVTAAAN